MNPTDAGEPALPLDFSRPSQDFVKWVRQNNLITSGNAKLKQASYLLHGPVTPGQPVIIHRIETIKQHRRQGWARVTVHALFERAQAVGCSQLRVRVPADSEANFFFLAIGFQIDTRPRDPRAPEPGFILYRYPLNIGDRPAPAPHRNRNPRVSQLG